MVAQVEAYGGEEGGRQAEPGEALGKGVGNSQPRPDVEEIGEVVAGQVGLAESLLNLPMPIRTGAVTEPHPRGEDDPRARREQNA